jgi:hypothetical protein
VGNIPDLKLNNYGFYDIFDQEFVDEYGNKLVEQPKLLGSYGVYTVWGIAQDINRELIIDKKLPAVRKE